MAQRVRVASWWIAGVVALAGMVPVSGAAQSMTDTFRGLFTFGSCGEPLCLDVDPTFHGQHFIPSVTQGENDLLGFMTGAIATSLGQIPFTAANSGSVLAGFQNGLPVYQEVSPGPILSERAQTLGRGTFVVSGNVNGISLSTIRGVGLDELEFNFAHQNVQDPALGNPVFEQDLIQIRTDLEFSLLAISVGAQYGLTDRVDVGVLVPIIRATLDGSSSAQFSSIAQAPTGAHRFTEGSPSSASSTVSNDATGIGDIGVRLKANLFQGSFDFGAIADVRLPTGDEEDFLGTGETTVRLVGVFSRQAEVWTPHLNAGVALRSGDTQANSFLVTAGFDALLSDQVTVAADVLGDFGFGDSGLTLPAPALYTAPVPASLELTNIPDETDNLVDVAFGLKFSTPSNFRIVANVLVPLLDGGVRPSAMWSVGVERVF